MIPVLGAKEMRLADSAAIRSGIPSIDLMESAATALADEAAAPLRGWRRVVVACGPGNNGGDGLAAARLLRESGIDVEVFTLIRPEAYRGDAAVNAARAADRGIKLTPLDGRGALSRFSKALEESDGAVDALFGTGLSRGLTGLAARVVHAINAGARPVVAADLPSGVSSDSGAVDGPAVRAAVTVAFGAPKYCHVLPPARGFCGRVVLRDIGIPRPFLERFRSRLRMIEAADVRRAVRARPSDAHKGALGSVAIVAGSHDKAGAAVLAARGALRAGAGLVTVFGIPAVRSAVLASLPEAMTRELPEREGMVAPEAAAALSRSLRDFDAAVIGPGLGTPAWMAEALRAVLRVRLPMVLDADALNAFAGAPAAFASRRSATVLTPHPGEAGRLLSIPARKVQADRLGSVTRLARRASRGGVVVVVLKGEGTLVATASGPVLVNPTGTPLLAASGSGDVLAGILGAFLAAGLSAADAAASAVFLHGLTGERLERRLGDAGLLASELADALPRTRREVLAPRLP